MATNAGAEQVIGYKYRTPLQADYLAFIMGHITNVGLASLPSINSSASVITIGGFSCFLNYSDKQNPEQLIKVVFKGTTSISMPSSAIAIGVQFSFKPTAATNPTADWYADYDVLTASDVASYPGIIVATCVKDTLSHWIVTTNGAEFSDAYLREIGVNPSCWLSLQNPRENPTSWFNTITIREHNKTASRSIRKETSLVSPVNITAPASLAAGSTHFFGYNASLQLSLLKTVSGNVSTATALPHASLLLGSVYIPSGAAVRPGVWSSAGVTPTVVSTYNQTSYLLSQYYSGSVNQVLVTRTNTRPVWENIKSTSSYTAGFTPATDNTTLMNGTAVEASFESHTKSTSSYNASTNVGASDNSKLLMNGTAVEASFESHTKSTSSYNASDNYLLMNGTAVEASFTSHTKSSSSYNASDNYLLMNGTAVEASFTSHTTDRTEATTASSSGTGLMTERAVYYALPQINGKDNYTSSTTIYAPTSSSSTDTDKVLIPGSTSPQWSATPTLTSVTTTSARAKKKDIEKFTDSALLLIKDIEIVKFHYKENDDEDHIGFIADDTVELLSSKNHDRMKLADCIALCIKAIQELSND